MRGEKLTLCMWLIPDDEVERWKHLPKPKPGPKPKHSAPPPAEA